MADDQEIKPPPGFVLDDIKPPAGFVLDPVEPSSPASAAGVPSAASAGTSDMPFPEPKGSGSLSHRFPATAAAADAVGEFGKGLWDQTNPVKIVEGLAQTTAHPLTTGKAMLDAQNAVAMKAIDAYKRGDYAEAGRHALSWMLPIVGPGIDAMGDVARSGNPARAAGEAVGFAVPAALGARTALAPETPLSVSSIPDTFVPETEAETAAKVSRTAAPGTEIEAYRQARNLQAARAAYATASPDMKQTMQQQWIMQAMKESGGDLAKFGELTEQAKGAIPFEDHQMFSGARNAATHESLLSQAGNKANSMMGLAELGGLMHVVSPKVAPALAVVNFTAKIVGKLMGSAEGRSALSRLGQLPPGTPQFSAAWSAARALAAPKVKANKIVISPEGAPDFQAKGGVVNEMKRRTVDRRAVLRSLGA